MVWSKWKMAAALAGLCAGLTCGLAYSQQAAPRPQAAGASSPEIITLNEPGKPPQQCVILKSTRLPNGQTALEMRNMATGEVTTLTTGEGPIANDAKPAPSNWAPTKSGARPMSFTEEKEDVNPSAENARPQPMPVGAPSKMPLASATPTQFRTIEEAGKPPLKCRILADWRTPEGHTAAQLQALETGEIVTIVEMEPAPGAPAGSGKMSAKLYHWGRSTTPPQGVPVPPQGVMVPVGNGPMPSSQPISTEMPTQQFQNFPSGDQNIVMPPSGKTSMNGQQKPSLGDHIKSAFNSLFPSRKSAQASAPMTTMQDGMPMTTVQGGTSMPMVMANSPNMPYTPTTTFQASEPVKVNEVVKSAPPIKSNEEPKPLDTPKLIDATKANDLIPLPEPIRAGAAAAFNVGPQMPEMSKAVEPAKGPEILLPEPPNSTPMVPTLPTTAQPVPASAPDASKSQWSPVDPKVQGFGKPSPDSTLPPGISSSVPQGQPKPAGKSGASRTPAPLATDNAKPWLPTSVAPSPILAATPRTNDPLASPESFAPPKMEANSTPAYEGPKMSGAGVAQATDNPRVPLGAASVVAAANGGDPRYLPQPIVTVPQARPPVPPGGLNLPAAETVDATNFTNAFTPPMSEAQKQQMQQMQQMTPTGYMMPQGYPPMTAQGYGPMQMPGQMPMGYPGPMPPNPMMAGQGYPMPMMPQAYPQMMPQAYPMPTMPVQPAMSYANQAMDRPGAQNPANASIQQCLTTLQSSIYPSQREAAIYQLCAFDCRTNPFVIPVLLTSAREDPAAMVRAAAVSALSRMGVGTDAALAVYNQLKTDSDPRVRQEAEQALARTIQSTGVQPAGATSIR